MKERVFLKAEGLTKSFENGDQKFDAVSGFSYCFPSRGLCCLTGESGSGKTTLLHMLSGLSKPTKGEVFLDGSSFYQNHKLDFLHVRACNYAYVFQEGNLLEDKTVRQNMLLVSSKNDEIEGALKKFGILEKVDVLVSRLSGGEKQRVAIARGLLKGARIIVFDEPTSSLDKQNSEEVFSLIKEASSLALCLVATHDQELAKKYADVLLTLEDGRLKEISERNAFEETIFEEGCRPKKGKLPLHYGLAMLYKRKTKFFASALLSVLSLFLVVSGASFTFFDPVPAFEDCLKKTGTWNVPLAIKLARESSDEEKFVNRGYALKARLEKDFGEVTPFTEAVSEIRGRPSGFNVQIYPFKEGLFIGGCEIKEPQKGEAVVSAFYNELSPEGVVFKRFEGKPEAQYKISQVVPVSYGENEILDFLGDADYQFERSDFFASHYSYVIVSREEFKSFGRTMAPVTLEASAFLPFGYNEGDIIRWGRTDFEVYQDQTLVAGTAPKAIDEVVVGLDALERCGLKAEEAVGRRFKFPDLRSFLDADFYSDLFCGYQLMESVLVTGVASQTFSVLATPAFMEEASRGDFENRLFYAICGEDPMTVGKFLVSGRYLSPLASFSPIYVLSNLKERGIGPILLAVEICFSTLAFAMGFIVGQDSVAGKSKEIALLETIGYRKHDFFLRYFLAFGVFFAVSFAVSALLSSLFLLVLNASFTASFGGYSLLMFTYQGALVAIGVSICAATISSLGSLARLARLDIADIYRGKGE